MATAEQRDDQAGDRGVLTDDGLGDLGAHGQERGAGSLGVGGRSGGAAGAVGCAGGWALREAPRAVLREAGSRHPAAAAPARAGGLVGWSVMGGGPSPRGR